MQLKIQVKLIFSPPIRGKTDIACPSLGPLDIEVQGNSKDTKVPLNISGQEPHTFKISCSHCPNLLHFMCYQIIFYIDL